VLRSILERRTGRVVVAEAHWQASHWYGEPHEQSPLRFSGQS
jgi:hypothetical protein